MLVLVLRTAKGKRVEARALVVEKTLHAAYVALAEALDAPLITCDAKLARSHGHRAVIELIE